LYSRIRRFSRLAKLISHLFARFSANEKLPGLADPIVGILVYHSPAVRQHAERHQDLGPATKDASIALLKILGGVSRGELTPIEAESVFKVIENYAETVRLSELEQRISEMEAGR
jgi:hypothetical protein